MYKNTAITIITFGFTANWVSIVYTYTIFVEETARDSEQNVKMYGAAHVGDISKISVCTYLSN